MAKDKEKRLRGPNYHPLEDTALCKAWCAATNDKFRGVSQKAEDFWDRVKENFDNDADIKARVGVVFVDRPSEKSLQPRFKTISHAVGKFIKCVNGAEQSAPSGTSPSDILLNAGTFYQLSHNKGKAFEFIGPYKILSKYPKFCLALNDDVALDSPGSKRARLSSDDELTEQHAEGPPSLNGSGKKKARLGGTKVAKSRLQEQRVAERKAVSGEKMAQAMLARNEIVQAEVMSRVFAATPVNQDHAEYLRIQRKLFMDVMRKKEQKHDADLAKVDATKSLLAAKVSIANLCTSGSGATATVTSGVATTSHNKGSVVRTENDIVDEANV